MANRLPVVRSQVLITAFDTATPEEQRQFLHRHLGMPLDDQRSALSYVHRNSPATFYRKLRFWLDPRNGFFRIDGRPQTATTELYASSLSQAERESYMSNG